MYELKRFLGGGQRLTPKLPQGVYATFWLKGLNQPGGSPAHGTLVLKPAEFFQQRATRISRFFGARQRGCDGYGSFVGNGGYQSGWNTKANCGECAGCGPRWFATSICAADSGKAEAGAPKR